MRIALFADQHKPQVSGVTLTLSRLVVIGTSVRAARSGVYS